MILYIWESQFKTVYTHRFLTHYRLSHPESVPFGGPYSATTDVSLVQDSYHLGIEAIDVECLWGEWAMESF